MRKRSSSSLQNLALRSANPPISLAGHLTFASYQVVARGGDISRQALANREFRSLFVSRSLFRLIAHGEFSFVSCRSQNEFAPLSIWVFRRSARAGTLKCYDQLG